MHAIWGAGQMSLTKIIVVVDEHVNVHDQDEVLFQLCSNVDPWRDITFTEGPVDILDHAAPACGTGSKMGIDATHKISGEGGGGARMAAGDRDVTRNQGPGHAAVGRVRVDLYCTVRVIISSVPSSDVPATDRYTSPPPRRSVCFGVSFVTAVAAAMLTSA